MHRTSQQNGVLSVPPAQGILDALTAPVAVLDRTGTIIATNRAWQDFGRANQAKETSHIGISYLDVCAKASGGDAPCARAAAAGIRSVLAGQTGFSLEYPCHSPDRQRWFQLRVSRLEHEGEVYAVVAHHDISERILVEQERQGLLARAEWRQEQLRALAAAAARIAAADSPEDTFQEITDQARLIIGVSWAATQTLSYGLWPHASVAVSLSRNFREASSPAVAAMAANIYTHVVQSGRPLRLTEAEVPRPEDHGRHGRRAEAPPLRGVLAVPLIGPQGGTMGVIMLSDKEDGDFTAADEALLVQLAQIASVSIENAARARVLRESRDRLLTTLEHADLGIAETDKTGRLLTVNSRFSAIAGYSRSELLNMTIFDLTHPENAEVERSLYERQVAGELKAYALEKRYLRKDGSVVWFAVSATGVFDEEGRFQYSVRVIQDIDQRKRQEQRQTLLLQDLQHRLRSIFTTVQALAGATARSGGSIREFTRSFSTRLAALAKAHARLTEGPWPMLSLREMLLHELQPFAHKKAERVSLEGPNIALPRDLAVALSMVVHELTANAAQHGALSARKGCVSVTWDVVTVGEKRTLVLKWVERNGPPVEEPAHSGYGLTLLQRVMPTQYQAQVHVAFERAGLQVEVNAPLTTQRGVAEP